MPVAYLNNKRQSNNCESTNNSLIGQKYIANRRLIIVLDAYPSKSYYKDLTGENSGLHNFLNNISTISEEDYTPYPYTVYSLAHLLGGIEKQSIDCHYPFFNNHNDVPRQLNGNKYMGNQNQICSEDEVVSFRPITTRIHKKFMQKNKCTILSPLLTTKIVNNLLSEKRQ